MAEQRPDTPQDGSEDPGADTQASAKAAPRAQTGPRARAGAGPASAAVAPTRLWVEHETRYVYAQSVELAHHLACLRPLSDAGQRLRMFDMSVSPLPAQHSTRTDAFGNSRAYFALSSPHTELVVRAQSEVDVWPRYDGIDLTGCLHCAQVAERLSYHARAPFEAASEFTYASPYVPLHEELRDYAAESLHPSRPVAEAAAELMQRIYRDFDYAPATTDISTPVLEVFESRQGVCQDFAHLMLACLRANGLAARYVSGYLLTEPAPGEERLVGADASHAWVSVWCPGLSGARAGEWLDLDPTNDCLPGARHIRVAHGRDFGDVTPLRGVIRGGGDHSLEVRVTTRPVESVVA
jgi:transglutaminase-like putative cysteine protease